MIEKIKERLVYILGALLVIFGFVINSLKRKNKQLEIEILTKDKDLKDLPLKSKQDTLEEKIKEVSEPKKVEENLDDKSIKDYWNKNS